MISMIIMIMIIMIRRSVIMVMIMELTGAVLDFYNLLTATGTVSDTNVHVTVGQ